MTRIQLLQLLLGQARNQGFEFRKWYQTHVGIPWSGSEHAIEWLSKGKRSHMLLFSHDFASHFWRRGDRITFVVPDQQFATVRADGSVQQVQRKAHLRRSSRSDTWQYHLREMAVAEEPLRYIRRYLLLEESIGDGSATGEEAAVGEDGAEVAPAGAGDAVEDVELTNYDDENLVRDPD